MKIDIDKFVCSLMRHTKSGYKITRGCISESLADQGLLYKDGEIVELQPDFKIEKGKWYMCTKDCYEGTFPKRPVFFAETMYLCEEDGMLPDEQGRDRVITENIAKFFRPATEEEIPHKPKFKTGDWLVNQPTGEVDCVLDVGDSCYFFNGTLIVSFKNEAQLRPWNFQDAKNGDVLVYDARWIILFDNFIDEDTVKYHALYNIETNETIINDSALLDKDALRPSTKEQRDLLFSKMREAGYVWDAEKKELRKIAHSTGVSADVTETDFGNKSAELTEFEYAVGDEIFDPPYTAEHIKVIKEESAKLMTLARKQIANEIDVRGLSRLWLNLNNQYDEDDFAFQSYRKGIEDVIAKIKEG